MRLMHALLFGPLLSCLKQSQSHWKLWRRCISRWLQRNEEGTFVFPSTPCLFISQFDLRPGSELWSQCCPPVVRSLNYQTDTNCAWEDLCSTQVQVRASMLPVWSINGPLVRLLLLKCHIINALPFLIFSLFKCMFLCISTGACCHCKCHTPILMCFCVCWSLFLLAPRLPHSCLKAEQQRVERGQGC